MITTISQTMKKMMIRPNKMMYLLCAVLLSGCGNFNHIPYISSQRYNECELLGFLPIELMYDYDANTVIRDDPRLESNEVKKNVEFCVDDFNKRVKGDPLCQIDYLDEIQPVGYIDYYVFGVTDTSTIIYAYDTKLKKFLFSFNPGWF